MLIDAREFTTGHTIDADLCIIGAGAVGIAMALEFDGTNKKVALIESGGFELDPRTQALYKGEYRSTDLFA